MTWRLYPKGWGPSYPGQKVGYLACTDQTAMLPKSLCLALSPTRTSSSCCLMCLQPFLERIWGTGFALTSSTSMYKMNSGNTDLHSFSILLLKKMTAGPGSGSVTIFSISSRGFFFVWAMFLKSAYSLLKNCNAGQVGTGVFACATSEGSHLMDYSNKCQICICC